MARRLFLILLQRAIPVRHRTQAHSAGGRSGARLNEGHTKRLAFALEVNQGAHALLPRKLEVPVHVVGLHRAQSSAGGALHTAISFRCPR